MAVERSIYLPLIITNIVISLCQSEVVHIHSIDDIKADMLLRGSAERNDEIDDKLVTNRDINKETNTHQGTINLNQETININEESLNSYTNKDIEPERSLRHLDEQNETAIEKTQNTIRKEKEKEDAIEANIDLKTTTDNVKINTNNPTDVVPEPEPLSLRDDNSSDEDKDVDDNYTTVLSTESTDSTTVKNKADTATESVDDEEFEKLDETHPVTTTKSTESRIADVFEPVAVPPSVSGLDDDLQYNQRVPKTDNEPRIQDKRFETYAPAPTPSRPDTAVKKSEILKRWLEDTWLRPPAGILVPLRPAALTQALAVWNDLTAEGLKVTDVVIIGYDSNGVNWRSRHNLQPTKTSKKDKTVAEALSKLILKYQHVEESTNDNTIKALAAASKLVPYDSALFVVTDKGPGDGQRINQAVRALVEKRLRVYTIWTDPKYPSAESERQLEDLRNISRHTEGDVLPYSMQVMDVEDNSADGPHWDSSKFDRKGKTVYKDQEDTLLVRRGGGEAISLGLPVENGVVSLRIFIEGLVEHAVLYPPNDAPQIDLYNMTSIHTFSPNSHMAGMSPRDVYLVFPGTSAEYDMLQVIPAPPPPSHEPSAPTVGVWHLSVRCDTCDYRLCVTARSQIHVSVTEDKDKMKIRVLGPVSSIRESMLVDEYGTELAKLPFSYHPVASVGKELPVATASTEINSDVPLPAVKGSRVYAKIVGRDVRGEPFVRLAGPLNQAMRTSRSASYTSYQDSEVNDLRRADEYNSRAYDRQRLGYNETSIVPNNRAGSVVVNQVGSLQTSVQIGLSSRLYGAPGDNLQLYFEVTNYRDQSVRFTFEAMGELRFLRGITPTSQTLGAGQTANVVVSVGITTTAQPGARDFITFTASTGYDTVSISTYVYVTNLGESSADVWSPELRHAFQGTCIGRQGMDCNQHTWSATVYARDAVSGLLRLSSTPTGIIYDSNFVSGTREQVIGTYRATCCNPRAVVTAVDARGNANSYIVDITTAFNNDQGVGYPTSYDIVEEIAEEIEGLNKADQLGYVGEAGIAAIVLGVLLFIALIALVVFLVNLCVKRRKESRELPYTASTRRDLS